MINEWWVGLEEENYWLEVTGRKDIGVNLKAPQTNEHYKEFWSYSFIKLISPGDIVFHYDRNVGAITAKSLGIGKYWEDSIVWAARGAAAREAGIAPHLRPGWYLGLEQFKTLTTPLSLDEIRNRREELIYKRDQLLSRVSNPLYFPFELGEKRPLRPMQGYLFKFPKFFVDTFPQLEENIQRREIRDEIQQIGSNYRLADEDTSVGQIDPFSIDPALVERGKRGHAETQNKLAEYLQKKGFKPRSPSYEEPNYDLAWESREYLYIVEVKSITHENEEKQLRLGLGQLLRYRYLLRDRLNVIGVLVTEHRPTDNSWEGLCNELQIILTCPEDWDQKLLPNQ